MKELTVLEQIVLVSILSLEQEAYGVAIRKRISTLTRKNLMYGTLYNALDQMHRKGFIQKSKKEAAGTGRGLHGRVYYTLTAAGKKALRSAYKLQKSMWASVPDLTQGGEF